METEGHDEDENMKNEQIDFIKGERPTQQQEAQEGDHTSAGEPKTATGIENAPAEDQSTELRLSDFQVVDTLGMWWIFYWDFLFNADLEYIFKGQARSDGSSSCVFDRQRNNQASSSTSL